jgi:hypothetical protein
MPVGEAGRDLRDRATTLGLGSGRRNLQTSAARGGSQLAAADQFCRW